MPYNIKKVKGGFKVCDMKGICLSNKPLPKKTALKQRIAVAISESKKSGKPVSGYFI